MHGGHRPEVQREGRLNCQQGWQLMTFDLTPCQVFYHTQQSFISGHTELKRYIVKEAQSYLLGISLF